MTQSELEYVVVEKNGNVPGKGLFLVSSCVPVGTAQTRQLQTEFSLAQLEHSKKCWLREAVAESSIDW